MKPKRENAEQTRNPNKHSNLPTHLHDLRQLSIDLRQINNLLPPLQSLRIPISRIVQIPINPLPILLIRTLRAKTVLDKLPAPGPAAVLASTMPHRLRTSKPLDAALSSPQNLDLMLPIIAVVVSVRPRRIPQRRVSQQIPEPQTLGTYIGPNR
jgi:hypothetical protein